MVSLSDSEKALFSSSQVLEVAKFPANRLTKPADYEGTQDQYRLMILNKWVQWSPGQLRAIRCIGSVAWTDKAVITWAAESDLSAEERTAVEGILRPGAKPIDVVVDVIGGLRSVDQRLAALEA